MRGQNQPRLPSEFCAPPLTDIITCPFYVVCPLFLLCLSAGRPNSLRSPCGVWIYSGGVALTERLDRPCAFCVCALRESLPRLAVPFASAHLSGLCASWWSGERILMTLPISTTDSPHRLYSFFFLPLNSNMYLKARETMSGTSRILWATLSLCLHLWVARVCHHVPFISNTCFIYFYTELRDHVSVSGLLVQAEAWRNCVEKDGCK